MNLKPWGEIIVPHPDVLNGTFQRSEFAAELTAVRMEYGDANAIYERIFLSPLTPPAPARVLTVHGAAAANANSLRMSIQRDTGAAKSTVPRRSVKAGVGPVSRGKGPTDFLVYSDAQCWESDSIDGPSFTVVDAEADARRNFESAVAGALAAAQADVEKILAWPKQFEFNSGYGGWALLIALPAGIVDVGGAKVWLQQIVDSDEPKRLKVVASKGSSLEPPQGRRKPLTRSWIVDSLLQRFS